MAQPLAISARIGGANHLSIAPRTRTVNGLTFSAACIDDRAMNPPCHTTPREHRHHDTLHVERDGCLQLGRAGGCPQLRPKLASKQDRPACPSRPASTAVICLPRRIWQRDFAGINAAE